VLLIGLIAVQPPPPDGALYTTVSVDPSMTLVKVGPTRLLTYTRLVSTLMPIQRGLSPTPTVAVPKVAPLITVTVSGPVVVPALAT
jgi:hypothetical protein